MRTQLTIVVTLCALATQAVAQDKPKVNQELAKVAGVWKVVSTGGHGKVVTAEGSTSHDGQPLWADTTFTIAGDRLTTNQEPVVLPDAKPEVGLYFAIRQEAGSYQLKVTKAKEEGAAAIDLIVGKEIVLKGIYELKGDELRLCVVNWLSCKGKDEPQQAKAADGKERPTDFTTKEGGEYVSYVLKRVKK